MTKNSNLLTWLRRQDASDNEEGSDKMGRRDSRALEEFLDTNGATTRQ